MSVSIVKINKYLDTVKDYIKNIDIVHDCQIYNKQIDFNTKKVMGVPLLDGKATCFIENIGSSVSQENSSILKRLLQNYTINIYIVAKNTKTAQANLRTGSIVCNEAVDKIQALLFEEDFDLNIEEPTLISSDLIDDASQVYVEYSIYYMQFTQRLTTHVRK